VRIVAGPFQEKVVVNIRAKLVVACTSALMAFPVLAAQPYDGAWRVNVDAKTVNARCTDRSVSLRVEEGNVRYAGLLSGLVSGKVARDGRLKAQMAKVVVSGKLSGASGSGAWRSPSCAGTWRAYRE
jgi:hypothetical protein